MDVRRRNRIVRAVHALVPTGAAFAFAWVLLQAGGRGWSMRGGAAAALAAVLAVALYQWMWAGRRRDERELDALAREMGIDARDVPDEPLPILPRLPLAKDWNELSAGVLLVVLVIAVFAAYYAGWIR